MGEKNFDVIVTTEEGEKIHLRPGPPFPSPTFGPPPNDFAVMLGLPEEWEISPDSLDLEPMRFIYDEETDTVKEVELVGPLHAWRVGDAGVSVSGKYRVVREWYRNERSGGLMAVGSEFWL